MTTVYEAANDSAKSRLVTGNVVSLLDVTVMAVPADRSQGIRVSIEFTTPFETGPAWLTESVGKIRHLCEDAAADFSEDSMDVMRTTLRRRSGSFCIWAVSVPSSMVADGFMCVDEERYIDSSVLDAESAERVRVRLSAVNEEMGRVMRRLLSGER
jgi:hypothetical protein